MSIVGHSPPLISLSLTVVDVFNVDATIGIKPLVIDTFQ